MIKAMFAATCALALPAFAERPWEKRSSADYVVSGTVDGVYRKDAGDNVDYVVAIKLDKVDKGSGWKPGEIFYAYYFHRKPDAPRIPSAGGHRGDPKEGQRIRAYTHRRDGRFEGNYPDWFDVLPAPSEKKE